MEELRAMARAADVPFEVLFRLNCYESRPPGQPMLERTPAGTIIHLPVKDPGTLNRANTGVRDIPEAVAAGDGGGESGGDGGCTSVASLGGEGSDGVVVGHTEDSFPEAVDGLYLLDATVTEPHPEVGAARSRFLSLNYSQTLPGCAAAVNEHGLVVLIDALPDPERQVGAPRHLVSRALLDLPSIEAAVELLRRTRRGAGWNYLLAQGRRVVNVEATATKVAVHEARSGSAYAHANHYLDPALAAASAQPRGNSLARQQRATELARPGMSVDEMKRVLSDRQGFPDSICRDRTLGAFIADTAARRVQVCWGEPDEGTWTSHWY
jgi:hypothetical protein